MSHNLSKDETKQHQRNINSPASVSDYAVAIGGAKAYKRYKKNNYRDPKILDGAERHYNCFVIWRR